MNAARHDLESARSHFRAAPHDYSVHRKAAVEAVNRRRRDVDEGPNAVEAKERRVELNGWKADHRVQRLAKRDERLKR
jgi:hypothetical protein